MDSIVNKNINEVDAEITCRSTRRLHLVLALVAAVWICLLGRIYYLQILCHEDLSAAAVSQYQVVVEGLDTRGSILDRNLQPLTGGTEAWYYFLLQDREDAASSELLAAVSARKISSSGSSISKYSVYRTQFFDRTVNKVLEEHYGAYVFCARARYSDTQTACHLIGYLNEAEKKGVAGLERACEGVLQAETGNLALWADSGGILLLDIPPKREGGNSLRQGTVITTIDSGLQRLVENTMKARNLRGGVLVSHADSGQVLAWVSAPDFNPNALAEYLHSGGDCLLNKPIQASYAPGSVFKIVVAAAALESELGDPLEVYECTGKEEVAGITLGCQAGPEGGHGEVDMYRAMAVSCNCYFARMGEKLGYERILEMAEHLGFGERVFQVFAEEAGGYLPDAASLGEWDTSNLSIGQGQILATPAQVHRMMSVLACGGEEVPLTVMLPKESEGDGRLLPDSDVSQESPAKSVLSPSSVSKLSDMLAMVMTEGTGKGNWSLPVYGKTGTAEAVSSGQAVNRCWFSGWCEVKGERFVVTVLAEEGSSGSASALPVFREITDYLQITGFRMD